MVWKIVLVLVCALTAGSCQRTYDDDFVAGDEIQGTAGIDYPVLASIPETGFTCDDIGVPGYYADPLSACQAYYICHTSGRGVGILCPNGTIFNQETLVCDWWYNFDCSLAVGLYGKNIDIVEAMAEVDAQNDLIRNDPRNAIRSNIPSFARTLGRSPLGNRGLGSPLGSRGLVSSLRPLGLVSPLGSRGLISPLVTRGVVSPLVSRGLVSALGSPRGLSGRLRLNNNIGRNTQSNVRRPSGNQSTGSRGNYDYNNGYQSNGKSSNNNNNNNNNYNEFDDDVEFNGYDANSNGISRAYLPPSK